MRAPKPLAPGNDSLIAQAGAAMAQAAAVRRASLEARTARAEAELAIKARSEFLANMNHELRTPLNAVIGFASMLKDPGAYPMDEEQRSAYAEYILQSADLLLGHINALLETAALDGGDVRMSPSKIDAAELVEGSRKRLKIAADAAKVAIDNKSGAGAVDGWGDSARLGQALDHVIRTAIKLSPQNGRVLVRAALDENGWAEIAVRDRSDGMSPETIARALNAFSETHRGLDRSFAGPGIGLAIAKTFIEMQGGHFHVASKIGEGTLVRLKLPPPKQQAAPAPDAMKLAS
jgi:two-component system cell cycle sensor histidine kinase PleC